MEVASPITRKFKEGLLSPNQARNNTEPIIFTKNDATVKTGEVTAVAAAAVAA